MQKSVIIIVLLIIVAGAAGFFGGMKYQQSRRPAFSGQFGNRQGFTGTNGQQQNRTRAGGGFVTGEVLSRDDNSITVRLQDGSSKIVLLSGTTTVSKTSEGSKSDLKTGERVGVFGTSNSDGSITAQNIQLNPALRGIMNGGT